MRALRLLTLAREKGIPVHAIGVQAAPLLLSAPGVHLWQVVWDGKVIHEQRLIVRLIDAPLHAGDG